MRRARFVTSRRKVPAANLALAMLPMQQLRSSWRSSRIVWLIPLMMAAGAGVCLGQEAAAAAKRVAPTIRFLAGEAARKALLDDSADGYFDRLTELEMAAKTGSPVAGETRKERVEETRRRYAEGVRTFSEREQAALRAHVERIDPILRERYPRLAALPWSFIKVTASIESGFPHTRGAHIVLSEPALMALAAGQGDEVAQAAARQMGAMLLLHEQLHVLQRKEPQLFDDLYTRVWNFRRAPQIEGAEKLKARIVVNPDGPDTVWILPVGEGEWVWPLIVFPEGMKEERAGLHRMQSIAVAVEAREGGGGFRVKTDETGAPVIRPLTQSKEYMKAFYPSEYVYHPNEASADLFARLVLHDSFGADADVPEERRERVEAGLKPIREWFAKKLGK